VIRRAAEAAGRPAPRVVAALPVALVRDPARARAAANQTFQIYGSLPSYRAMLDREGVAAPGDVALVGDEQHLRAELRRVQEAGVTHFAASLYEAEAGAAQRTYEFLAGEL
jgi:hypothetical protein